MIDEDVYSRLFTCIELFLSTRLFYDVVTLLHTEPNTSVTNKEPTKNIDLNHQITKQLSRLTLIHFLNVIIDFGYLQK
jgi:hypothetical protein